MDNNFLGVNPLIISWEIYKEGLREREGGGNEGSHRTLYECIYPQSVLMSLVT